MNRVSKDRILLIATIALAISAIVESIFRSDVGYLLTPFFAWIPTLIIWSGLWVCLVISVLRIRSLKPDVKSINIASVLILICAMLVAKAIPLERIYIHVDHKLKKGKREHFVVSAESMGVEVQSNTVNEILLPNHLTHLSKNGGSIKWFRDENADSVLFYWWHGMFGVENGFLYCSQGMLPENSFLEYTLMRSHKKLDDNWYFIWCSR
jgi:hypothetical protein